MSHISKIELEVNDLNTMAANNGWIFVKACR